MSIGPIANLTSSYLQSILGSVVQTAGLSSGSNTVGTTQTAAVPQTDGSQLSPFAQVLSSLQQLQQSNPSQYQQVTQQIATNLESAAQTAQAQGNTTAANQLNQLATDFKNASQNGQLPNVQGLAQAAHGHHHHHFHGSATQSNSSSDANTNALSDTTGTASDSRLSQLLAAFQPGGTQNQTLNPLGIIESTLASSGITVPG